MVEQLDLFDLEIEDIKAPTTTKEPTRKNKEKKDSPLPQSQKTKVVQKIENTSTKEPKEKRVALFVGDKVRVKESLIHAAKDVNAEDYYYFKEYEGLVGTIESKNYAKKGAYYEVSYKNKRLAVFNHHEIEKVEK